REEPRRATRIGICRNVLIFHMKRFPRRPLISHAPITAFAWLFSPRTYALLVHFFSGVLIQQHIRRKTTSRRFTRRLRRNSITRSVSKRHLRGIAAIHSSLRPSLNRCAHPACVDV